MYKRPVLQDGGDWNKILFQVEIGDEFATVADAMRFMNNVYGGYIKHSSKMSGNLMSNESLSDFLGVPTYINKVYFRDTRIGANDAINCLPQFNRDDDIVHPMMQTQPNGVGMGRVYAATAEQNQTIAWFTFGVPKFAQLKMFFEQAFNSDLIALNNTGFSRNVNLLGLLGTALSYVYMIPFVAFNYISDFLTKIFKDYPVDRFYSFRPTMHLYYKYVDSILAEWLVATGIYGNGRSEDDDKGLNSWTADPESLPLGIRATGPGIFDILARRATMFSQDTNRNIIDDQGKASKLFEKNVKELVKMDKDTYDRDPSNALSAPWSGVGDDDGFGTMFLRTMCGATQFVGFRIEKGTSNSESFSNSTGPSSVAQMYNNKASEYLQRRFAIAYDGSDSHTGVDALDTIIKGGADILRGMAAGLNMDNLASGLMGGAFIDIPDQYTGSDFSKSYSISFQLRAMYGTITSRYQSIMVPLAMILAATLPRAAGKYAYSHPFLCRVYCKGMFSIPMGIIDSVSIDRGSSEFGWSYEGMPTCINVTISIKDLSPAMYITIRDGFFENIFANNNSFNEYMLTLAGAGLFERISAMSRIRRKTQLLSHKLRNRITNPMYHASWISDTAVVQTVNAFVPWTDVSHN